MNEQTNLIEIQKNNFFSIKNLVPSLVMVLGFLLPIFFVPLQTVSFAMGKSILLITFVFLLLILWLFERIKNKDFSFSKNLIIISSVLVLLSYFLSSLFSGFVKATLFGYEFGVNSFSMILAFFLLMFFTARFFVEKKKIIYLYIGLLFSSIFLLFFHVLRLIFGPDFLSLGLLGTTTSNLVGAWNELGIFFGLVALLSLLTAVLIKENVVIRVVSWISLAISLFFLVLVNFTSVWWMLSLLSLLLIFYNWLGKRNLGQKIEKKDISIISIIVLVVSLLFIFAKGPIGGFLPSLFNISNMEVRPSLNSTIDVIQSSMVDSPILGVGPNEFVKQWLLSKPIGINNTQFWNIDFNSGTSFILTSLVNVGFLGFLAWLLFFASIVFLGFKLLRVSLRNKFDRYIAWSVFSATIYLWVFSFIYVPGIVVLSLSFLFSGLLLSLFYQEKIVKVEVISLLKNRGKGFIFLVVMAGFLLLSMFGMFLFINKTNASFQAQKSFLALNSEGDLGKSVELMEKAAKNSGYDLYYRLLSNINIFQLQAVLNQTDVAEETVAKQFQTALDSAITNANTAISKDSKNYQNWLSLGNVYRSVVPLKIEGAYDNALKSYSNAIIFNPYNPLIALSLANLEIANGDVEKAKGYLNTSIQMKNNYSDAYYLLSQIELNGGNQEGAVNILKTLTQVTPNDSQAFLQLGALEYNTRDYKEAIASLEQSFNLNPYSVDTIYLLGLSYSETGEREEAVKVFDYLQSLLPNDTSISSILENLRNGKAPLSGLTGQSIENNITESATEI